LRRILISNSATYLETCHTIAKEFGSNGITANVVALSKTETDATSNLPENGQMKHTIINNTPLERIAQS
jgi:NAD(P)-dependent dehydrogenase (short-subunit alcohol dehydrogenase family)